jgi:peptidoglycan biosynthesis protein MviN/MurJ (putative lipid II flippase)
LGKREEEKGGETMKRIFAILMACLFMVAVMAVLAAPAFADCCITVNKQGHETNGQGNGQTEVHKNSLKPK